MNSSFGENAAILRNIRQEYLLCKPPQQIQGLDNFLGTTCSSTLTRDYKMYLDHANQLYKVTSIGEKEAHHEPPIQYRIAFVKHIIKQLEMVGSFESAQCDKRDDSRAEEEDDNESASTLWYDSLEFLSGMEKQTEPFYRIYELPENCGFVKIFENEGGTFVSEGTTGLVVWEASIELARWLCHSEHHEKIKKRKWMLELGSGCGLLACAIVKTFPHLSKYIASDGHISAVQQCKVNVDTNFGTLKTDVIQVEEIDWGKDGRKFEKLVRILSEEFGAGVLLGADIVFDPALIAPLVKLIEVFLENHKDSIALVACTIRNEKTLGVFKRCLESHHFQFKEVYTWGDKNGIIYKLTKDCNTEMKEHT